jgi:hypothetical protein
LSLDRYRELLECLSVHWSTQPPARRQRREPRAGDILVTHDFASIRRVIGFGELARNGRTLEYDRFSAYAMNAQLRTRDADTLRSPTAAVTVPADEALRNLRTYEEAMESGALETWRLVDATGEGLGADAVEAAWAKAGMLVAYRRPDSADWALAVVRRLNRAASGTLRVGLRKLPGAASTARVSLNGGRLPLAADKTAEPAMHYDAITLTASHDCMLVPAGAFDPAWHCTLAVGRSRHAIRMARRIEYGLDFELLEYARASVQQAA